jgi:hypothetical protein
MMSNTHESHEEYYEQNYSNTKQYLDYGTKIIPGYRSRLIIFLRLVLLMLSIIAAIQMIVTFLPTAGMYIIGFLISLAGINVLFYIVSKRRWTKKTPTGFDRRTRMTFFFALFLIAATAILPKSTLVSFLLLISFWLAAICINMFFFSLWAFKEAKSYLHD